MWNCGQNDITDFKTTLPSNYTQSLVSLWEKNPKDKFSRRSPKGRGNYRIAGSYRIKSWFKVSYAELKLQREVQAWYPHPGDICSTITAIITYIVFGWTGFQYRWNKIQKRRLYGSYSQKAYDHITLNHCFSSDDKSETSHPFGIKGCNLCRNI